MRPLVERSVGRSSVVAAALGVLLSPIPLADELALVPVYALLTWRIGKEHGLGLDAIPWQPIAATTLAGLAARAAVNLTVSYIPGVAAVANAVSAVALTRLLGRYIDEACERPEEVHAVTVREFLERLKHAVG